MPKSIYLDFASGAVPNPSSVHQAGVKAKEILTQARAQTAGILHARPDEVVFTSGGTESNNLAILGSPKGHIVTTNIEHASVLETCKHRGNATFVSVESNGIVDPKKIKKALRKDTALVSVMYANNEIGTIQPIREIAKTVRHYNKNNGANILFHTDAVQAANYLDLNVDRLGVDLMTISGSKIHGSPKVGVLYKKRQAKLRPIMWGGDQEFGLRPGTEDVEAIAKFAAAFERAQKIKDKETKRLAALRDRFFAGLKKLSPQIKINGDIKNRLPNNANITVKNIPGDLLVIELSERGIDASSKSACKAGDGKASHVLKAIDPGLSETDGAVRFSFGATTKKSDIDAAILALKQILTKLKRWYN